MAEPLKTFFSPALVCRFAADLARADPAFRTRAFVAAASAGLEPLELLDRGRHIARVLAAHLPPSYPKAVDVLLRSLGPEHPGDELLGAGMAPFFYLPHLLFVAAHGLDHFDLSMRALYELTKRFSAEASIRAFIARDPERVMERLEAWAADANPHVRRLVSEGTRLRLPWAPRVAWLDAHPHRVVALLDRLKDDPSTMVRRSVANNLNDLGKVHPQLLVDTAGAWLAESSPVRRRLIEHALRSAVKRGHPDALRLLGYGSAPAVRLEDVSFDPPRVAIGERVAMRFTLRSTASRPQDLLIDAAVHFVKARGQTSARVFKIGRRTLPRRASIALRATVSLAVHTTRVPHPGTHVVDVLVNGRSMPAGSFEVVAAAPAARRRRTAP